MRKVLADTSATVVFHLLNLISGTGDPQHYEGEWGCYEIVRLEEDKGERRRAGGSVA